MRGHFGFAFVTASALLGGCLDFEHDFAMYCARHTCSDGGTNGGGAAGGEPSGGGPAGGGASTGGGTSNGGGTGGAGTGGGEGFDGGLSCPGSSAKRLQCTLVDSASGDYTLYGALAASGDEYLFLLSSSTPSRIDLLGYAFDAHVARARFSANASAPITGASVAAEGKFWALGWLERGEDGGVDYSCATSSGERVRLRTAEPMSGISVAVTADGGVAVSLRAKRKTHMYMAQSSVGCPQSFAQPHEASRIEDDAVGVGAVHRPGTGAEGFRFSMSGDDNYDGTWAAYTLFDNDGGVKGSRFATSGPYTFSDSSSALSGNTILIAYFFYTLNLQTKGLAVKAMPYDTSTSGLLAPVDLDAGEVLGWSASTCGNRCLAVPYLGAHRHLSVHFLDEGLGDHGLYDVKCEPGVAQGLGLSAYGGGHFGVALNTLQTYELFDCRVPTF